MHKIPGFSFFLTLTPSRSLTSLKSANCSSKFNSGEKGSWEKVFCVRKMFSSLSIATLTSVLPPPPPQKKYQDKNHTQKVWHLIVVALANKQCAIVLPFSPKWEQVVEINCDPWNALSRCCVKTFTMFTMKHVIVCGLIKKRQTNRWQKQLANYCAMKDHLYIKRLRNKTFA